MPKPKLYVGCSLQHAPLAFIASVERLKEILDEYFEVLEFLGLGDDTPQEVFQHDVGCVRDSDAMLAVCDFPSTGLGEEIGIAYCENKPILAVAHVDTVVSKMILGIDLPNFSFYRYTDLDEVVPIARCLLT